MALTEQECITYVKNYYKLLNQYATDAIENITVAKKIESLHIGKGFVYPDIEINLGTGMPEIEAVAIKSVYLPSISSRQNLLLKFVPTKISMLKSYSGTYTMTYMIDVYSDNEQAGKSIWKYSVPLEMGITDGGKIKCIKKRTIPTTQIKSIKVEQNVESDDGKGIAIHIAFDIQNMINKKGMVVAYFYDNNNKAIRDLNETRYGTASPDSHVIAWKNFTPNHNNTIYRNFTLTIPYNELHQFGTNSRILKFKIIVWNMSVDSPEEIYRENTYNTFTYTPIQENIQNNRQIQAEIQKINVYNIVASNQMKSVSIILTCKVNASKGESIKILALFYNGNGTKCYTTAPNFRSSDGQISVQAVRRCEYDGDNLLHAKLNIPSSILPSGDIGIDIILLDSNGDTLVKSPRRQFTVR